MDATQYLLLLAYILPTALLFHFYWRRFRKKQAQHSQTLAQSVAAGLTEPASMHPVIDPNRCVGSGACIKVCPEQALGLVAGKAVLVNPGHCIGHGACAAACPMEAIQLVFGTEKRGMDIPLLSPEFETTVPGIFIAGELGGMGLVRKAVEQGRQAVDTIAKRRAQGQQLDLLIVGAGPAGLSAALAAKEKQLNFVIIEQEDALGGTIYHYPRNKLVMTAPMRLPIIGVVKMQEISKEDLLTFWQDVVDKTGLHIRFNEAMQQIQTDADGLIVTSAHNRYHSRNVLLAIGRRGSPRKLGVPGEEQPKVVYRLIDPEQYRHQSVLVVGGGDSALEAALAIADEPSSGVTLSYRSEAFGRVKPKNRERLQQAEQAGKVKVMLSSTVQAIHPERVLIEQTGQIYDIPNQAVIVCAGGVLPTPFLKEIGVIVETKFGRA